MLRKVSIFGDAAFSHSGKCKITGVTFFNGNAAIHGVSISPFSLGVSQAPLKLHGTAGVTSQFWFEGFPFDTGFVVTPSDTAVTNIVVEYEADHE